MQLNKLKAQWPQLDSYTRAVVEWRCKWLETARPKQLAPPGDWDVWALICGRGFGKSRTGAEYLGFEAATRPNTRYFAAAPTWGDCGDVQFEGKSGLANVIPSQLIAKNGFNKSKLLLTLKNGSQIKGFSAERPDKFRGPEHHGGWADEIASWGAVRTGGKQSEGAKLKDAWDNMHFGLRLGLKPRIITTGTPRPIKFLRDLIKDPKVFAVYGSTFENEANLAASSIAKFREVYAGTRKGEQELMGRILEDAAGKLWNHAQFEQLRVHELPPGVEIVRSVLAIDPAVTSEDDSDETGMIVAGMGDDGFVYVLADLSGQYTPIQWAVLALATYRRFECNAVIGETNQGGDLVESNLRGQAEGEYFQFIKIHAKRGKYLRAEPIAAYYEKKKVRHVGRHVQLEQQMVEFTGSTGGKSPDRLDALVYAVGELMLGTSKHDFF